MSQNPSAPNVAPQQPNPQEPPDEEEEDDFSPFRKERLALPGVAERLERVFAEGPRAYELMSIIREALDADEAHQAGRLIESRIDSEPGIVLLERDWWGLRRFAYPINHETHGYYVVLEFVSAGANLADLEHWLRLQDFTVRSKLVRLPDHEARRRRLLPQVARVFQSEPV